MQGNRIAGTGSDEGTAGYWEEQGFEVIDCGDGLIIPGMIDAHMHFFDGIFQNSRYMCRDLFDCRSAEECVKVIGDFARKHPEYRTVTGMGWFPPGWTDSRRPDKKMLDEIGARPRVSDVRGRTLFLAEFQGAGGMRRDPAESWPLER